MNRSRIITLLAALLLVVAGYFGAGQPGGPGPGQADRTDATAFQQAMPRADARSTITRAELPPEARQVISMIRAGGPFPYDKDGSIFGNRERLLPSQERGYYREYTVPTPGAGNRGARRIVAGGPRTNPNEMFYTADHYQSFRLIQEDDR